MGPIGLEGEPGPVGRVGLSGYPGANLQGRKGMKIIHILFHLQYGIEMECD